MVSLIYHLHSPFVSPFNNLVMKWRDRKQAKKTSKEKQWTNRCDVNEIFVIVRRFRQLTEFLVRNNKNIRIMKKICLYMSFFLLLPNNNCTLLLAKVEWISIHLLSHQVSSIFFFFICPSEEEIPNKNER